MRGLGPWGAGRFLVPPRGVPCDSAWPLGRWHRESQPREAEPVPGPTLESTGASWAVTRPGRVGMWLASGHRGTGCSGRQVPAGAPTVRVESCVWQSGGPPARGRVCRGASLASGAPPGRGTLAGHGKPVSVGLLGAGGPSLVSRHRLRQLDEAREPCGLSVCSRDAWGSSPEVTRACTLPEAQP